MTDTLQALAADYRTFLAKLEAINDDHSPGAIWCRAARAARVNPEKARAWKARAIGLNPEPLHNAIALSGMTPLMFEERWHLAVALPQPSPCGPALDLIEDVILIDPAANTAHVMGDPTVPYIAPAAELERIAIRTDPKEWARDIALARLEWFKTRSQRRRLLQAEPQWVGDIPSALIMGPLKRVRWSDFRTKVLDVPADLRRDVHRAVLDQARLPKVEGRA